MVRRALIGLVALAVFVVVLSIGLAWFFDPYLLEAELPVLEVRRNAATVELEWRPDGFVLPVPVRVDGRDLRLDPADGPMVVTAPGGAEVLVDPDGWMLCEIIQE